MVDKEIIKLEGPPLGIQIHVPEEPELLSDSALHTLADRWKGLRLKSSSGFDYDKLSAQGQIRLLTLQPGIVRHQVRCSLGTHNLDHIPPYEALSYAWGDPDDSGSVLINESQVKISTTLEQALRRLRHAMHPRLIWVDALCINQQDEEEKKAQMARFFEIYQQAENVVAWVGESADGSEDALNLVKSFSEFLDGQNFSSENETIKAGDKVDLPELFEKRGFSLDKLNWPAYYTFLDRPYFQRLWVLTELATRGHWAGLNLNSCTIQCGGHKVQLGDLQKVVEQVLGMMTNIKFTAEDFDDGSPKLREPFKSLVRRGGKPPAGTFLIIAMKQLHTTAWSPGLRQLLIISSMLEAADERDKLYALLGLVPQSDQIVSADYSKPMAKVMAELVEGSIKKYGTLEITYSNRREPCTCDLPTWVPDIHRDHEAVSTWDDDAATLEARWDPCGGKPPDVAFLTSSDAGGGQKLIMQARGIVIGKVATAIGPFNDDERQTSNADTIDSAGVTDASEDFSKRMKEFGKGLDKDSKDFDALWRAMMINLDPLNASDDCNPSEEAFIGALQWFDKIELPSEQYPALESVEGAIATLQRFMSPMLKRMMHRTFFATEDHKHMGAGPWGTQVGDLAVVLYGSRRCFVLRPKQEEEVDQDEAGYHVIGQAYVHGVMDGELVKNGSPDIVFNLY